MFTLCYSHIDYKGNYLLREKIYTCFVDYYNKKSELMLMKRATASV